MMHSVDFSASRHAQSGVMLIEALLALLIFSLGVLGIVGLQSTAVKVSGDARYRSEAALYANELIGKMWAADRNTKITPPPAKWAMELAFDSSTGNPVAYQAWAYAGTGATLGTVSNPAVGTVMAALPGSKTNPPVVKITPVTRTVTTASGATETVTTFQVEVTINWQAPQEAGDSGVHSYKAVAHIGG